ncbi:uncharacterized protein LTR77_009403 [Saxophila tyrrhenica]|uniref:Uncharacterized protein n=1 Tax=Saxophila tyrrhenica TaxID=1690608 RepID=A0AAV9P1N0_9PEZI|nr:hypothetical protein LTR77_009403 [Saxophila tyrrhenica]
MTPPPMGEVAHTSTDARDMGRMGKVQQVKRYFGPWGLMGFASVTGAVWQYVLLTLIWSFPNGGASGAFYMYIVCAVGLMLNTLSLAEMASTSEHHYSFRT